MPLHDYRCESCGSEFEAVVKWDEREIHCPDCTKGMAKRQYKSFNGIKHDAPDWLQDTLHVVDKEGGSHCQEFLKSPTRENYKKWMKGEGLRPMEEGEGPKNRKKPDTSSIRKAVQDKFRKDNSITVGGSK